MPTKQDLVGLALVLVGVLLGLFIGHKVFGGDEAPLGHDFVLEACSPAPGGVDIVGTIANLTAEPSSFIVTVDVIDRERVVVGKATFSTGQLLPGESANAKVFAEAQSVYACDVYQVLRDPVMTVRRRARATG